MESAKKDKKKDKKDKDKGYATLAGGDSSPDEDDTKYVYVVIRHKRPLLTS